LLWFRFFLCRSSSRFRRCYSPDCGSSFRHSAPLLDLSTSFAGGGIAWWAHIGGFIAGIILAGPLRPPRRRHWPRDVDEGIPGFALSGIV
jgi:hypothetical protein